MAERSSSGRQDDIRMSQVLKESRETQCVHTTRDYGSCLNHALPFLLIVWSLCHIILKHVCNQLIRSVTLHFSKTHSSNVDAAGTNDAGYFGVHKCCVSPLRLWAGNCTMAGTVVVQELLGEIAASHGDGSPS